MNFIVAKSSSIYETFSPLYKVLKFFGIIPFQLEMKSGEVALNRSDLIKIFLFWIFWSFLLFANLLFGLRGPIETSRILLCGWHWIIIGQLLASFFIQIINLLRRKSIGKLLKLIDEVDMMVRGLIDDLKVKNSLFISFHFQNTSMKFKANHSSFKTLTIQTIIGSQLIYLALSFFTTFSMHLHLKEAFEFNFHFNIAFSYISFVYCLTYHQFLFATSSIKLRFELLNMNLS